jgi:hypothetical protein
MQKRAETLAIVTAAAKEALARNDLSFVADEVAGLLGDFRIDLDNRLPCLSKARYCGSQTVCLGSQSEDRSSSRGVHRDTRRASTRTTIVAVRDADSSTPRMEEIRRSARRDGKRV